MKVRCMTALLACFLFGPLVESRVWAHCPPCSGCETCICPVCVDMDSKCGPFCCHHCWWAHCWSLDSDCSGCCGCSYGCNCTDVDYTCSGCCSCVYCSCHDQDTKCSGCCECTNCGCVDESSNCAADKCCDGCSCIDRCDADGDSCYFTWPEVETPMDGCQNPDPMDKSCEDVIYGLICAWVQTIPYHLTSAKCADCDPACKQPSGDYCAELTPWKCNNDFVPGVGMFCVCNDDLAGIPSDHGTHYECK